MLGCDTDAIILISFSAFSLSFSDRNGILTWMLFTNFILSSWHRLSYPPFCELYKHCCTIPHLILRYNMYLIYQQSQTNLAFIINIHHLLLKYLYLFYSTFVLLQQLSQIPHQHFSPRDNILAHFSDLKTQMIKFT